MWALTSVYLAASRGNGHTGDQLMERFKAVVDERKTDKVTLERKIVANLRTTFTHLEKDSGPLGVTCHGVICAANSVGLICCSMCLHLNAPQLFPVVSCSLEP